MDEQEKRDRELFDRIAEKYCSKDIKPASRAARRQRLLQTLRLVELPADASLLEVGCGAGFSAEYLAGRFGDFTGIDYAENLVAYAVEHFGSDQARFEVADLKQFQPGKSYDAIFMIGVLHHVVGMEEALEQLFALLKPGGWLLANEPHPANPLLHGLRVLRKRMDRDYSEEQLELSKKQMTELLAGAGFKDLRFRPQGLFSTPFAEVIMPAQPITGALSKLSCLADTALEALFGRALHPFSWNLIAAGRKPE